MKNWQVTTVGEVLQLEYGKPLGEVDRISTGKYPVYGANGEKDRTNEFYYAKPSIIVGRKGSAGEINLTEERFWPLDVTYFVTFDDAKFDLKFLYYLLSTLDLPSLARGVKPGINRNDVYSLPVKTCSLDEQKRIVRILDQAFEGIATAKANAKKNLQSAHLLFDCHLRQVFKTGGGEWKNTQLEKVCGFQNGFAFRSSTFKPSGSPILRISNIQDGTVNTEKLVFFNPKDYKENLDKYQIVNDDLLIAMSGATTGKIGFNTNTETYYLNQRVGKFEPGPILDKRFLYYFLSTRVKENLEMSLGAAQPNLSTEQIKNFVLPLPPLIEQDRVVEACDSLLSNIQHLKSICTQKLHRWNDFEQSLLHQAFTGQL